ncbi:MAG TPA: GNAT family protein [Dermatophilaceae bacterium]|nr:GNAT family protein [Dermatophilaceae bacterium]
MPAPARRPPGGHPLLGRVVRLDPLVPADAPDLYAALDDSRVWQAGFGGGPAGRPRSVPAMASFLERIRTRGAGHAAYTIRLVESATVVGTSSLGDVDLTNSRVHLGWTAYAPGWWGTGVNAAAKLLLLGHAFDDCGFERVKLQTDALNARSQAAIARLGAVREGVLRHHMVRADGSWRDTVVFSVLAREWPAVREGLLHRLPS